MLALAGIELRYLVNLTSEKSAGYYVSNIYGITRDSILFKLHHPEKADLLLVVSTFGMWFTTVKIEQIEQNKLVKRLRSDLVRLKLTKIEQPDAERIAFLTFSGFDNEFILVCEFFGDGNILLCNKEMKILALLHSIDVRHRKLSVGLQYSLPPSSGLNIFNLKKEDFSKIRDDDIEISRWVGRTLGLPRKYAEEICKLSNIESKTQTKLLLDSQIDAIYDNTLKMVSNVVDGIHSPIIDKSKNPPEALPIKTEENSQSVSDVETFEKALDMVFTDILLNKGKEIQSGVSNSKIEELEKQLQEQTRAIDLVKKRSHMIADVARSIFDMSRLGISRIQDNHSVEILEGLSSKITKDKGIDYLVVGEQKIPINLESSLQTIASSLYDESKKQSNAIKAIEEIKAKTQKNIEKLYGKAEEQKDSLSFWQVRKKNWFERYRWFITSDGLMAIGGRDSSSNSAIIRKYLEKNDKVFHAEVFGSPFFILKNEPNPPETSFNEVAQATVCFSRAWREGLYGASAYWVNPEQVKKSAPSGQFLPRGSFTIEGQRNFIRTPTLRLAVGLIKYEDDFLVCCGPPQPIKKSSVCYAIIEPMGSDMVDVAKKIKSEFMNMKENLAKSIDLDDFVRVLPAGKARAIEFGLGDATI